MKFKSIIISKKGGPEVLQVVENEFRLLDKEEVLIKIQACGVGRTDIGYRRGEIAFAPKIPFVPGYEILGIVDAIGEGVTKVAKGDRVAALTGHGGYSEYIYLGQEHLVRVPTSLNPAEAVTVVLNYVAAYQMLHRSVQVKAGDKVLIIGATGGVGTALLQLGKLSNLVMYGTATKDKFKVLEELGATPIDYKNQSLIDILSKAEAKGIDFVFDGVGGKYGKIGLEVLRKGGKVVEFTPAPKGISMVTKCDSLIISDP
jgi:NADPH:quinone reductase-like Zn-dependent oxidoreductase